MTINNYLNICPTSLIHCQKEQFHGLIKPMNYSLWSKHDPLTLLLEGIHQFGVRISILTNPHTHHQSGSRIPGQLKQVTIKEQLNYMDHRISGTCIVINDLYLVTFSVTTLDFISVIEGQLYIATVPASE